MSMLLYLLILVPIIFGILVYLVPKKIQLYLAVCGQVIQLALSVICFINAKAQPITISLGGWNPPVGIMLVGDSISTVLALLTSVLFLSFIIYNSHRDYMNRVFFMLYMTLQALLTGIFLLDDLFSIFVLVEVSTMVVSLLIMFKRDSRSMYDGLIYLLINTFSMTFFLFGLALLYKQLGTFSLSYIAQILPTVTNIKPLYLPYAMLMTSVCLKSAIMPLFSWLPKAHGTPSAPSVVSAVLSGLYVKGGIYLFFRISTAFSIIDTSSFFLVCGVITAIVGFLFALSQHDIKLILSYHTVSQLGLIMLALSMNSKYALWGAMYHIVSHALFKSVLFLCAGVIVEEYSTRDVFKISGVFQRMPLVSIACILAIFGITGAPLFNGSISKYLISHGTSNVMMQGLLMVINLGTLLSFIKFFRIFKKDETAKRVKVPLNRQLVLVALGSMCLVGGIFGSFTLNMLFGVDIHIKSSEYIYKSVVFAITLIIAHFVYKSGVTNTKPFMKIRALDLGFNDIALTLPAFFCVLLGYLIFM